MVDLPAVSLNLRAQKDFIRFDAETENVETKSNTAANIAYYNSIECKYNVIQNVKSDEQRLKRQAKWVAAKPPQTKEGQPSEEQQQEEEEEEGELALAEEEEDKEGLEIYDVRDRRVNNSMHIKDLLKRNPTLKNSLQKNLKKDLLEGIYER